MTGVEQLFRYDEWANREALHSLLGASAPPPKAVAIMAHIPATLQLWFARIEQQPAPAPVWPAWPLQEISAQLERAAAHFPAIFARDRNQIVAYTNTQGQHWESRIEDILTHLVMHGAYHRGQVAVLLRDGGGAPAYTDYIHAVRNRLAFADTNQ